MPVLTKEYLKCRPKLPPILYHYCSVNTFLSIVENYNIWLSDAEKTNDNTEMRWLFDKIKSVIDEIISSYEDIFDHELLNRTKAIISEVIEKLLLKKAPIVKNAKSFLFCLSEANDLLSQWRAYGNDGKGVAIGFNTEVLSEFMSNPFYTLTKVIYNQEDTFKFLHMALDEQLKWSIESSIDSSNYGYNESELVVNIFMLIYGIWEEGFVYKNNMFIEEQEWRIFRKVHSDNYSNDNGVDDYGYTDFLDGFFICNDKYLGDFTRSALKFRSTEDDLRVYFELGFEKRKKDIIKEIIIGPKCKVDSLDIKLLLTKNGYMENTFSDSVHIRKSKCPYI